jgi:hypothetical protein
MSCVRNFICRYKFGDKKGVTGPHRVGATEPASAPGPAPLHDLGPGDYHFHKHALDG